MSTPEKAPAEYSLLVGEVIFPSDLLSTSSATFPSPDAEIEGTTHLPDLQNQINTAESFTDLPDIAKIKLSGNKNLLLLFQERMSLILHKQIAAAPSIYEVPSVSFLQQSYKTGKINEFIYSNKLEAIQAKIFQLLQRDIHQTQDVFQLPEVSFIINMVSKKALNLGDAKHLRELIQEKWYQYLSHLLTTNRDTITRAAIKKAKNAQRISQSQMQALLTLI